MHSGVHLFQHQGMLRMYTVHVNWQVSVCLFSLSAIKPAYLIFKNIFAVELPFKMNCSTQFYPLVGSGEMGVKKKYTNVSQL